MHRRGSSSSPLTKIVFHPIIVIVWTGACRTATIRCVKPLRDWSVYVARCADMSLYTGIAKDVDARIAAHNLGRGAAYTRSRRPVSLVYHRKAMTHSAALSEEARIKTLERAGKIAFLKKAAGIAGRTALYCALLLAFAAPVGAIPVFNKENGISISSTTPQAFTGDTGGAAYAPLRMYYLPAISSGAPHASSGTAILSATSGDGLAWVQETGVRVDTNTAPSVAAVSITGCAIQPLAGGGFRMLYSIVSTTGAFRIHTATSANGLTWSNESAVAVNGGTTYVGVPRIVVLNSGDWRLYYTRDFNGGNDLSDRRIFTALSSNEGALWGASSIILSTTAYESGAAKLTDGKIRLFYSSPPSPGSSATVILSALSNDALGVSFTIETGARISTPTATGAVCFPVPIHSTDSFRWRLYYSYYEAFKSTGDIRSALTGAPAPVALSPSTVYQSAGPVSLTITGDIFSLLPTVSITQNATTLAGTSVNRIDDQTISATFATQNQNLGNWDLTVTNADGTPTVVPGALLIDFAPGSVALTGNLLRPREGIPVTINTTIFNSGRVLIRIYDPDGRPVRTVFDGERAAGAFTVIWDGKNASGAAVASGLYFVAVNGPKIATKRKIILIR